MFAWFFLESAGSFLHYPLLPCEESSSFLQGNLWLGALNPVLEMCFGLLSSVKELSPR